MTVPVAPRFLNMLGNGTTGPYTFNFPILLSNSGVPYITLTKFSAAGVATVLAYPGDYTFVPTALGKSGGIITTAVLVPNDGSRLFAQAATPLDQAVAYRNQGDFFPETHENSYDKLHYIVQEAAYASGTALRIPSTDVTGTNTLLPSAALRANGFLGFDALGNVLVGGSPSIVIPTPAGGNALYYLRVNAGGTAYETTQVGIFTTLTAQYAAVTGTSPPSYGMYKFDATTLAFSAGGVVQATLNGSGNFIAAGSVTAIGGGSFDSPTFVIDATNHRIGVGTASPLYELHLKKTNAGGVNRLVVEQVSAAAASGARVVIIAPQASTGDPDLVFDNGVISLFMGMDNSDGNKFKIGSGALGSADFFTINPTNGNTGIGNNAPDTRLNITGYLRLGATAASNYKSTGGNGILLETGANSGIEVVNSTSGAGYGMKFYGFDPGTGTHYRIAGRNNNAAFTDYFAFTDGGIFVAGGVVTVASNGGTCVIQTNGGTIPTSAMSAGRFSADSSPARFIGLKSRHATVGSHTVVQANDELLNVSSEGSDGSGFFIAGRLVFICDAAPSAGIIPGKISLRTASAAGTLTEAIGIDRTQAVFFTNVATTASAANAFLNNGAANSLLRSTSSLKYKQDVEPVDPALMEKILQLRPVWYRSKCAADNPEWSHWGVIAEEVAKVDPRFVHYGYQEDAYDEVIDEEIEESEIEELIEDKLVKRTIKSVVKTARRVLKEGAVMVPDGVQYERLTVPLLFISQQLKAENADLKKRLETIEAKLGI